MSAYDAKCPLCAAEFRAPDGERLTVETNASLQLDRHMAAEHADARFFCPRGPGAESPFKPPMDGSAFWRSDRTCSYCGSLHPDAFFEAVQAGGKITPTDKSYKAYVELAQDRPDELRVISAITWDPPAPEADGWIKADPEALRRDGWGTGDDRPYKWFKLVRRGPTTTGKFYFQHLDEAQMHRFIELVNAKSMKLAYPGYFYVRPFFCAPATAG